ncbi:pentatricopeptide repeat-containing protein [Pyrus ussuriensis x Pyrus communis]|uniref:Pentatricopeptide repeat-containing protein n=1 Tax=Pyrus ussuriensis x Pyrus communis TaxID=2448454 RepID=A0A5N5I3U7_9ROSA|nr:pentatricopeptide repeat-containing protein [Pyrus ussuriensis x Pyrus communis]
MPLPKHHIHKLPSLHRSPSDAALADKAITYLKRHPQHLTSLSSHFTPEAASCVLLKSQFDQTLTLNFLNWARNRQFLTFPCKCLALHILTRFKLYKSAQSLAEDVALNTVDDGGSLVFQCLADSFHSCNSSSAVFDLVVKSYSHLNFIDKAMNIVSLAKVHGFMPGVLSYNAILDAIIRSKGSVKFAEEVWSEMIRNGVSPNVYTYNILIRGCSGAGNLQMGLYFFGEMERNGCLPNVVTYNTLIDAYCKLKRIDEAFELFRSMVFKGLEPNLISYNVVINGFGYCKAGNFHQALVLQEDMQRNGLSPNVVTYTALINAMCKAKNLKRAMEFFDQMRIRGLRPNERTYTTLIDGFSQQGFLNEAYGAIGVIQDMIGKGLLPDAVSYSTIITGYCRHQELESAFRMKQEMVEKGVSPDAVTYSSLIQGVCQQRRLVEACDLFQEMLSMGMRPDEFTYTTLINAYCGLMKEADQVFETMIKRKYKPNEAVYDVIIHGHCRGGSVQKAYNLYKEMLHFGFIPHTVTVIALIKELFTEGMNKELNQVIGNMLRSSQVSDAELAKLLVEVNHKEGNMDAVFNVLSEMAKDGLLPNSGVAACAGG